MPPFDRVIVADWSSAGQRSPARPSANAIWLGTTSAQGTTTTYCRSRAEAEAMICAEITSGAGRLLIGFDFPMGYPQGFAIQLTGTASAVSVWQWLAKNLEDAADNRNNRFALAARINRQLGATGPFWGRPQHMNLPDLPARKTVDYAALGFAERRRVEDVVRRVQPVWKLYTVGAAGAQGLVGQAMIHRLRNLAGVSVWPFERPDAPTVLAEVYPSLLAQQVAKDPAPIKDEAQVRLLSKALWRLSQADQLEVLLATPAAPITTEEGWILGADNAALLAATI